MSSSSTSANTKASPTINGEPNQNSTTQIDWKQKYEEEQKKCAKLQEKLDWIKQKELEEEKTITEVMNMQEQYAKEKEQLLAKNRQLEDDLQVFEF